MQIPSGLIFTQHLRSSSSKLLRSSNISLIPTPTGARSARSAAVVAHDAYTKLNVCQYHYSDGVIRENDSGRSPDSLKVISALIDGVDVRVGEEAGEEYRRRDDVVFFQNFFEYADREVAHRFVVHTGSLCTQYAHADAHRFVVEKAVDKLRCACYSVDFVPNGSQDVCKSDFIFREGRGDRSFLGCDAADRLLDMLLEGKGDWDFDLLSETEVAVQMRFYCCVPPGLLGASPAAPADLGMSQ